MSESQVGSKSILKNFPDLSLEIFINYIRIKNDV